ncbi:hypothetical protein [Luteibacter aegosomatissinici]|uniref:hypothetical protein n=1 Tax=Luteibacter aegosomatissinici TaxID=2911539 RepID=UPI001FF938E8|nr:hypothetical protein [Luteibacter aegosomatissinici]UPG95147.1 hypothetical protein L2Y97_03295 [Luteibacter aegosomatissinici]
MGLSVAVLAAVVFLLPGAAFVFAFQRDAPQARQSPLDGQVSETLAKAVVAAIALNALWYGVWWRICEGLALPLPDASGFLALASGGNVPRAERAIHDVGRYPLRIAAYFCALTMFGGAFGTFARLIRARIRGRGDAAVWGRVLSPLGVEFVGLTLDVDLSGTTFLYTGILRDYALDRSGELERVVLETTMRKPLPLGHEEPDPWTSISGDFVVIRVGKASTVKVDYFRPGSPTLALAARGLLGA